MSRAYDYLSLLKPKLMLAAIIGISSGIFIILLLLVLKQYDKKVIYGLTLTGIGFIYVGFTWTDLSSLIVCSIQAFVFLALAYYGIKKSIYILALGFFLHGIWDLVYTVFDQPGLIPPEYDVFCLTIDFTFGIYLLIFARKIAPNKKILSGSI